MPGLTLVEHDLWRILEGMAGGESVLRFVPQISPRYMRPNHLAAVADALARARHGPVKVCIDVPPRHSKTETILHGCAWRLDMDNVPETEIAYVTYEANLAHAKSRKIQELARAAGVAMRFPQAGHEWRTEGGAVVRATGIGGPLTGNGTNLLIVDDPLKNREEAESAVVREKVWDWFTSTALTRLEPQASVIVVHTRWHDNDLIGRLQEGLAGDDWEFISLPALSDEGLPTERALWPERWPVPELLNKRRMVGEYDWASLFMGQPRPKGGRLFRDATRYGMHDPDGCWYLIGCDPAATESTAADYSVACVLACKGRPGTIGFSVQVVDVRRMQCTIPDLVKHLHHLALEWRAPVAVEAVGGFKAVPQMLRQLAGRSLRIFEGHPSTDKFIRAQAAAAAWNDHRISVPGNDFAPWVRPFVSEITKFTGVKDAHDDQVDALVHGFNAASLATPHARGVFPLGWREV